jgi:N-acetylglucosamine-6-phosphate deacetylase
VVTPDGVLSDAEVRIVDGGIEAIGAATGPPTFDLLTAGFVDIQVNGVDDVDVATASDADWVRLGSMLAAQGVTSWCPTLVSAPLTAVTERAAVIARRMAEPVGAGSADAVAIHLEGPFLGGAPGAHRDVIAGPVDIEWIDRLPSAVGLVTLGPERPGAAEAIAAMVGRGITVALGHTTADYDETVAAIGAGARLFTHAFNASGPLHHRRPGALGAALTDDRVAISLIADGIHVHPAVLRLAWRAKPAGTVVLVTDAVAWRAGRLADAGVTVVDGAPRLADGTLAGSCLTMAEAVRCCVERAGIGLVEALRAASSTPAALLGLTDRGVLAPGRRADVVALTDALEVAATWIAGERV